MLPPTLPPIACPPAQALLAYCRLLLDPSDDAALLQVIPPWPGLGPGAATALLRLRHPGAPPLTRAARRRGATDQLAAPQRRALADLLDILERLRW